MMWCPWLDIANLLSFVQAIKHAQSVASSKGWSFSSENIITEQSGSANNWGHGYHHHGARLVSKVCSLVEKVK